MDDVVDSQLVSMDEGNQAVRELLLVDVQLVQYLGLRDGDGLEDVVQVLLLPREMGQRELELISLQDINFFAKLRLLHAGLLKSNLGSCHAMNWEVSSLQWIRIQVVRVQELPDPVNALDVDIRLRGLDGIKEQAGLDGLDQLFLLHRLFSLLIALVLSVVGTLGLVELLSEVIKLSLPLSCGSHVVKGLQILFRVDCDAVLVTRATLDLRWDYLARGKRKPLQESLYVLLSRLYT